MTKYKILMLSDHPLSTSGVGVQSRFLIDGLVATGKYSFRCFGAAVKHENYNVVKISDDFIIKPTDGFGTPEMIRHALVTEQPDAMLLFTDPRFFTMHFAHEDEIHQFCPMIFNHIWDNFPVPTFNKYVYDTMDLINCINTVSYEISNSWYPEKTNYIPHAIPNGIYFPLPKLDREMLKRNMLGNNKADHFVGLFVGRNAHRKMVPDLLRSWRLFIDKAIKKHNTDKFTLLLHCDPMDQEGTNLYQLCDTLNLKEYIVFSKDRTEFNTMNAIYNIADVQFNYSKAEGFGLPILEGKLTGLPAVTIKTGGLTRQIEDHITGFQYGVALDPEVQSCTGNHLVPFIYEDYVSVETYSNAIMKVFEMSQEERTQLSFKCIEHANRDYKYEDMINNWDRTLTDTIENWHSRYERYNCVTL